MSAGGAGANPGPIPGANPGPSSAVERNGGTAERTSAAPGLSYSASGVDIDAADRAVELMKGSVASARRSEVVGDLGGFAGLFDASALTRYRRPLLATSTDGVGTKVAIAQAMDIHDTVGFDMVGMVIDDLVVCGAEPLFLTDYIAAGKVVPERTAAIVQGVADACAAGGCALVGGEVAEHPGLLEPDAYDLAGAATGVVEADEQLGPDRVRAGDVVVAMASSGLHSNGYSLVRAIVAAAGWELTRYVDELGRTLGEALLEPTRIYTRACLEIAAAHDVHAMAHVTGGGLAANLARVIPERLLARVERASWTPPAVFEVLGDLGGVAADERERTWNLGIGMFAVVGAADADAVVRRLEQAGQPAWIAGEVSPAPTEHARAAEQAATAELIQAR